MTADLAAIRAEINALAERRSDAILHGGRRATDTRPCPSHAALLHRLAALITTEDLPPARIVVSGRDILVDATGCELVESCVRRWAQALELVVTEVAGDGPGDVATTLWSASGWDGTGTWWHVAGSEPVAAVCEAGR